MKNFSIFFALTFMVVASSFSNKTTVYNFNGQWSETWGVGQKTDVDYHDQYTIRTHDDGEKITCQSSEFYRFINVKFKNDSLTFKIINTSGNDTMPYYLRLDKKSKKLKGIAYSVRGEKTKIEWKRVK